jgi:hypothetical protein
MSAGEIKAELSARWRDDPIVGLCSAIVDYVAALPADQARMLTFRTLSSAVGKENLDEELLRALTILVSSRVAALDAHGLFVDHDQHEYELGPGEFARIRATGQLIHPETGELILDSESRVIPFFTPSGRFLAER